MSKPEKIHWPVVFSAAGRKDWPRPAVVDFFLHPAFGGIGLTAYGKQTLDQVRQEYPDAVLMDERSAYEAHDNAYKCPPKRITAEQWDYALNVLPPCNWYRGGSQETFYVSEKITGPIANIYCRIGEEYFELQDDCRMTPGEIVKKCIEFRDANPQG